MCREKSPCFQAFRCKPRRLEGEQDLNLLRCLQIQHLYVVLGRTAGGTRKVAMASLRKDYEKNFKYSGKV